MSPLESSVTLPPLMPLTRVTPASTTPYSSTLLCAWLQPKVASRQPSGRRWRFMEGCCDRSTELPMCVIDETGL